jgi:hypothetical protein
MLEHLKTAEVRGSHFSWVEMGSDGVVSKGIGSGIDIENGRLSFGSGLGWSAGLYDAADFHGRMIARKVTSGGGIEVTARVVLLEDLKGTLAGFFDASGGSDPILRTRVVDELVERKNLPPQNAMLWPAVEQGPLEGVLLAEVVIDRTGRVQDVGGVLSDNPGLSAAARERISKMQFKPLFFEGLPVHVLTTVTMPFKTARPAGVENFESARTYFEKGRSVGFLAARASAPYTLKAEFTTVGRSGVVEKGIYTDTWLSDGQWRREVSFGKSRYVRSRNAAKRYQLAEGPEVGLLKLVMELMEPIPALDTFVESDWRIKRDTVDEFATMRIARGYESPDGKPDAVHFNGYWFDDTGQLVKLYENGFEVRRKRFSNFDTVPVARRIELLRDGKLGLILEVTELGLATVVDAGAFVIKGHEWTRQFTAEVR